MKKVLGKKFFNRGALVVAKELLGKYLIRKLNGKEIALKITEVEAYAGLKDKASHAHKGKTQRNEIMFGEAGYWYVYLCYGAYDMLNIVADKKHYPAAVLIRGAGDFNGPGKLTKHLKINGKFNKRKANKSSGLWIEDRGEKISSARRRNKIIATPRIGVDYAGPIWSKKHYRFVLKSY